MAKRSDLPQMRQPVNQLSRLQRQIDRLFDESLSSFPWNPWSGSVADSFMPACDIEDRGSHLMLVFDLPGIHKEDIRIELIDRQLRVSGERKEEHEEKEKSRYRMERFQGGFERVFTLPSGVDANQIETEYRDGVLRIAIPKVEEAQAQQIPIGEKRGGGFFERLVGRKRGEPKEAA